MDIPKYFPQSMAVKRLTFLLYPMELAFSKSVENGSSLSGLLGFLLISSGGKARVQGRGEENKTTK